MDHPSIPFSQPTDHYQLEAQRLSLETERQRREIVALRKDLAGALTQYARACIVVQNIGRYQTAITAAADADAEYYGLDTVAFDKNVGKALAELRKSLDNWFENQLGAPHEILERIDILNQPIPDEP